MIELATLLVFSVPVALAALGESISQKGGLINIGLEGMMLFAALAGTLVSGESGSAWLGLAAGVLTGLGFAAFQAFFTLRLAADQVVVGTAMNLFALGMTGTIFRLRYGQTGSLISVPKVPSFWGVDGVVLFMLLSVIFLSALLFKTKWGLALRAAGEYPKALSAAGFSVLKVRLQGALLGGAFAGLAGAYLSLGIAGSFAENLTAGRGFVAIAMVTFGRWKPVWVLGASLLVGWLDSLQFQFQARGLQLPFQLLVMAPYVLALLVLIAVGRRTLGPAALGSSFVKK